MTSILRARGLRIQERLQSTDVTLDESVFAGVIGPNGGGKTSLIRALADVEGSAELLDIAGEDLQTAPPARRSSLIGFLPASREVIWPISVESVVALGLAAPDPAEIAEMLALFGIHALRQRPINSLSTGERSRVLLARACGARPKLLLLDEPLSNMDPYWALRTLEIVKQMVREHCSAALVTLHDLHHAEAFDRLFVIDDGRILADGPPQEVLESETLRRCFGIERQSGRWRIKRPEDPRSSP